jgi:hypothetical protein
VTRRLVAACVLCACLAVPAAALAQQDPNPATTAQQTTPGATTPGATTPPATVPGTTAPATTPPATTTPATTPPPPPATTAAAASTQPTVDSGNDRAAVLLLLLVGALMLLALVLWAIARWQAYDPPWLARWRHATGEAGWRAGNAWAEFTDWIRIGR